MCRIHLQCGRLLTRNGHTKPSPCLLATPSILRWIEIRMSRLLGHKWTKHGIYSLCIKKYIWLLLQCEVLWILEIYCVTSWWQRRIISFFSWLFRFWRRSIVSSHALQMVFSFTHFSPISTRHEKHTHVYIYLYCLL